MQNKKLVEPRTEQSQFSQLDTYKIEKKVLDQLVVLFGEGQKSKRNYEDLYYKERSEQNQKSYLAILKERLSKQTGLYPAYMSAKSPVKARISDIQRIRLSPQPERVPRSNLESTIEKQVIVMNTDGQESLQIENIIEEESATKIEIDEQIQDRMKE